VTFDNKIRTTEFLNFSEKLVHKTFDIRNGEGIRVVLMWLYIFLIISSLLIVKPVVASLFLYKFGADRLAYAFMLIAIFAAPISTFYSKLLKKIPLNTVIIRTLQIVVAFLFLFRIFLLFNLAEGWILYIFYVLVAIFAVIASSQFWIFANLIFNAREAKRLFGLIGAGAIAGGIFGGYLTNFLAPIISSENLIFICIAFLAIGIPIIKRLWREHSKSGEENKFLRLQQSEKMIENPFSLLRTSRHLFFLACLVGIGVLVGKIVEYQFSAVASMNILDEDELTAFFGFWLSNLNIVSLLIQLFVTRRVVGVFGVGTSLFFLPFGILFGAIAVLISPALWAAILIKISDGSLKNSINKAGMELLALPIPLEIKNTAKSFIDVFVDSFATGISGIMLGILAIGFDFSVRQISLFIILLLGLWIYLVFRVRQEYIQTFRMKLIAPKDEVPEMPLDIEKESVFGGLLKILDGDDEQQILNVLRMVKTIKNDRLLPSFKKLISHPASQVQLEVLRNIYFYKHVDFSEQVKELVFDENLAVQTEALHYLFQHEEENKIRMLQSYLNHSDYKVSGAALLCAARESRTNQKLKEQFKIESTVVQMLKQLHEIPGKQQIQFSKIICAKVIGAADIPDLYPYLHFLFNDSSLEVEQVAIENAGQTRQVEYIPVLIQSLKRKELWNSVQEALIQYGQESIHTLNSHLSNPYVDKNIRRGIPRVLFLMGDQKAVDVLIQNLVIRDLAVRYEVINALYQLRLNFPYLKFRAANIVKRIFDEANDYVNTLTFLYSQARTNSKSTNQQSDDEQIKKARELLVDTLEQRLDHNLERIFRLLGLAYPPEDIEYAYAGIKSNKPDVRINAVEFLDNLLEMNLKKVIIPIAESALVDAMIEDSVKTLGLKIKSEFECLVTLLSSEDSRLQIHALALVGQLKDDRYLPFIARLLDSPDGEVKEMAKFAVKKMGIMI
jgi:AAA family ATP:ADP antiporter